MAERVLVLSAAVGAGHVRAAQAVELALKELAPQATVKNLDVLQLTNAAFRRVYGRGYLDLVNKAPHVLGYFYDVMDRPGRTRRHIRDRMRVVAFPKPNADDLDALLPAVIADLARERGLEQSWVPPFDGVEQTAVARNWRGGSVRRLRRIVEAVLRERDVRATRN